MPLLDVFSDDAFSTVSMLRPIERVETVPNHLGSMGIFDERAIGMNAAAIEEPSGTTSERPKRSKSAPRASLWSCQDETFDDDGFSLWLAVSVGDE